MATGLPLEGIRVLDLTQAWAGPFATKALADLGAEVIKVEGVSHHDFVRDFQILDGAPPRRFNMSAYFNEYNRNKLGLAIDFAKPKGRRLLLSVAAHCDVMIENSRPGVMEALGLSRAAFRERRADIILVTMPAYGERGPEGSYPGFGPAIEQTAGLTSFTGYSDGPPQKTGISYGDPVGGLAAACATIIGVIQRRRTGKGIDADVSQREAVQCLIGEALASFSLFERQPAKNGNRHPRMAPHGVFRALGQDEASDSWIAIAVRDDREFARLVEVMGRPSWAQAFTTLTERKDREDELEAKLSKWTSRFDRYELMHKLQALGIPAGPVLGPRGLVRDPHMIARGFYPIVNHPDHGARKLSAPVMRMSRTPATIRMPAPCFGQHTREILTRLLNLRSTELDELERDGIIGDTPTAYRSSA